jgi:hypothetical protein
MALMAGSIACARVCLWLVSLAQTPSSQSQVLSLSPSVVKEHQLTIYSYNCNTSPPNAIELSRLRAGRASYIIHPLCQQEMLEKCSGSNSAAANG